MRINLRAPGAGEEEDVDADEGNHGLDGSVGAGDSSDDGNDELADNHAKSTPDEQRSSSNLLHRPEGDGGGADVDEGGDEGDQEGVVDSSELLEEGSSCNELERDSVN